MIRNSQGKALGIQDAETLAGFLLHYMNAELRVKLMAEHPAVYARVFPEVSEERILEIVRGQIHDDRKDKVIDVRLLRARNPQLRRCRGNRQFRMGCSAPV